MKLQQKTLFVNGRPRKIPASFKAAGKPPVKGGRWRVRKVIYAGSFPVWRAWSLGTAGRYSRSFHTWAEAIEWAQSHAGR